MTNRNDALLPTRDYLRQLLGQTYVKNNELKSILRGRGVFSSNEDKKLLGGTLIKTGLSAGEYLELKESYKSKEDNPKILTRNIKWSSDANLFDAMEEDIDFESLLEDDFGTTRLSTQPMFTQVDGGNPDHIRVDFVLERNDITKNWGENTTYHKGYLELNKDSGTLDVQLTLCHTSKEVRDFGDKLTKKIIKKLKSDSHIKQENNMVSIRFDDFDNRGRVKFLNELSFDWRLNELYFKDTKDLQFSPGVFDDKTPENLKWMKDTIEDLKLRGKGIHSTFFVANKAYHQYIKLYRISCDYEFKESSLEGICRINFEFHDGESNNSELTVDISNMNITVNTRAINKDMIKTRVLRLLDKKKIELYEKHRIRATSPVPVKVALSK